MTSIRLTLLIAAAALLPAQEKFDMAVRNDFFAGFAGDRTALARGLKKCEEVLAANPKHAEALVWHGSGIFFGAGEAARAKDYPKAAELSKRGLDEMSAAVALAPANVSVLVPRGAVLLAASHSIQGDFGRDLLKTGLEDYEKVYRIQTSFFDKLGGHMRGELLFGIAEAYHRLGEKDRAREWFEKLAAVNDPANGHLQQARDYLSTGTLSGTTGCVGCHVGK